MRRTKKPLDIDKLLIRGSLTVLIIIGALLVLLAVSDAPSEAVIIVLMLMFIVLGVLYFIVEARRQKQRTEQLKAKLAARKAASVTQTASVPQTASVTQAAAQPSVTQAASAPKKDVAAPPKPRRVLTWQQLDEKALREVLGENECYTRTGQALLLEQALYVVPALQGLCQPGFSGHALQNACNGDEAMEAIDRFAADAGRVLRSVGEEEVWPILSRMRSGELLTAWQAVRFYARCSDAPEAYGDLLKLLHKQLEEV